MSKADSKPATAERAACPKVTWAALHQAVVAVASIADAEVQSAHADWTALAEAAAPWRLERAEVELADLAAVMRAGLGTLIAVKRRGADARWAAAALLAEFAEARLALINLLAPVTWPGAESSTTT